MIENSVAESHTDTQGMTQQRPASRTLQTWRAAPGKSHRRKATSQTEVNGNHCSPTRQVSIHKQLHSRLLGFTMTIKYARLQGKLEKTQKLMAALNPKHLSYLPADKGYSADKRLQFWVINTGPDKEKVVHPYNRILFSHQKGNKF